MKRKAFIAAVAVLAALLAYFAVPGFLKNTTAYIGEYTVSADGSEITLTIGTASSAGYIRAVAARREEGGKLWLDCYGAFGGVNGRICAKEKFTLPLGEDTTVIGICRGAGCYEEVLNKDADGVWQRVQ